MVPFDHLVVAGMFHLNSLGLLDIVQTSIHRVHDSTRCHGFAF